MALLFRISYPLVPAPKVEICIKYCLVKNSPKPPLCFKKHFQTFASLSYPLKSICKSSFYSFHWILFTSRYLLKCIFCFNTYDIFPVSRENPFPNFSCIFLNPNIFFNLDSNYGIAAVYLLPRLDRLGYFFKHYLSKAGKNTL